ncbi:MAG: type II secretion system protein, partial [bacterium]
MEQSKLKKGFTLIEIVIVLAIAALIMVVVFVAVQGAQRSQRDQARKDIAGRTLAAVQSYRG